jgi:hypothetical protein
MFAIRSAVFCVLVAPMPRALAAWNDKFLREEKIFPAEFAQLK